MLIPVLSKPIWEVKSEMLKVEELNVYYDKIHAVKGVSFEAVSYTHLDVYKRQVRRIPLPAGPGKTD